MEDDLRWREERERRLAEKKESHAAQVDATVNESDEFQEKDDEDIYFAPERGNVIFASAVDGWGFRVGKFAHLYAVKLGMKEANLRRVLWGDFYLDPKTKRVISYKHLRGRALKPLFVQFVLENGPVQDRLLIIAKLRGQMLQMAKHKFASNVCEKALVTADPENRRLLIEEIMTPKADGVSPIVTMMKDQYASAYIFQHYFKTCPNML